MEILDYAPMIASALKYILKQNSKAADKTYKNEFEKMISDSKKLEETNQLILGTEICDEENLSKETLWDEIKLKKTTMLNGIHGSGKTTVLKKLMCVAKKDDYKIISIKAWDYDGYSDPINLFIKKLLFTDIFIEEDMDRLRVLAYFFGNSSVKQYQSILIDTAKSFFKSAKFKDEEKLAIFIDELDRTKPEYALELIEFLTIYCGVEEILENDKGLGLFSKATTVLYSLNKTIMDDVFSGIFYISDDKKSAFVKGFWPKYIHNIIDIEKINVKEFLSNSIYENIKELSSFWDGVHISGIDIRYMKTNVLEELSKIKKQDYAIAHYILGWVAFDEKIARIITPSSFAFRLEKLIKEKNIVEAVQLVSGMSQDSSPGYWNRLLILDANTMQKLNLTFDKNLFR